MITTDDFMPPSFSAGVSLLRRPYLPITEKQYEGIRAQTQNTGDIVIYKNKRMTFGTADGGFALMPLAAQ